MSEFRVSDYMNIYDSEHLIAKNANEAIQNYFENNNIKDVPVRPRYQGQKDYDGRFHVVNVNTNRWSYYNRDGKSFNPSLGIENDCNDVY